MNAIPVFHLCRVAVAPLRKEASDRSEIVSQLLFGDRVHLLEKGEKWCRVVTHHDQYEGWMDHKQLAAVDEQEFMADDAFRYVTDAVLDNTLIAADGSKYYLAPGTTLPYYHDGYCHIGEENYKVTFNPVIPNRAFFIEKVDKIARFYENTPYLWGGRTLFGIDCSGFAQAVYKLNGIQLPRDAYQQAEQGELVNFLTEARLGDLAFFDNEEGRITHVGLMLNNHEIIHAAGRVHIDPIDNQGIFSKELGRYTHRLRIIKRF